MSKNLGLTPQIKKWLDCKPVNWKNTFGKIFLFDKRKFKKSNIDQSGFSSNTKDILVRIGNAQSGGQMTAIINAQKNCHP